LDEHTGQDQRTFGPQLGEDVSHHVVVVAYVVKLRALEVSLELAYVGAVGIHRILLDVAHLVDLVDDDLRVAISDELLDSQGNSDAQSVNQGLILSTIVGRLVVDLQDVFQMITMGRDEEYTCVCSFKVQGIIEVHLLVLRLLRRWGLLGLCPLRDEVYMGLDGLSWTELKLEFT
jgi:hypothetical protein